MGQVHYIPYANFLRGEEFWHAGIKYTRLDEFHAEYEIGGDKILTHVPTGFHADGNEGLIIIPKPDNGSTGLSSERDSNSVRDIKTD